MALLLVLDPDSSSQPLSIQGSDVGGGAAADTVIDGAIATVRVGGETDFDGAQTLLDPVETELDAFEALVEEGVRCLEVLGDAVPRRHLLESRVDVPERAVEILPELRVHSALVTSGRR